MLSHDGPGVIDADRFSDVDRRRRGAQAAAGVIIDRAAALCDEDRALLELVYRDHCTLRDLARLRGLPPHRIRRHIARLTRRVLSPEFAFVARFRSAWSPVRRRVAGECFLLGHSVREAAKAAGISYHAARRHLDAVRSLLEASRTRPPASHPGKEP